MALSAIEAAIESVNPTAVIVRTQGSAVDLNAILDIRAMAGLRQSPLPPSICALRFVDLVTVLNIRPLVVLRQSSLPPHVRTQHSAHSRAHIAQRTWHGVIPHGTI